ncbi:RNA helicase [Exophiala xenobiotica]|nr:RNA helicase [Exophiala xenobiotica]KAK5224066.1 RNA helicase [Exophiala xenobiotica]KAK5226732.1 RNA helicase [Exophiala xenobiotica]KAK5249383.1 RNA helicase [Exophiala xenobiotica]KAK5283699.1 RNA helicase [Exophiala xenobiotica]
MASAMRQRRKPSRMTLTEDVSRSGSERRAAKRNDVGPFAGMNQTLARIPERRVPRQLPSRTRMSLRSEIKKRSERAKPSATSDGDGETTSVAIKKSKVDKDERPTFHALKMQQILAPLSYSQRDKLKLKMEQIKSFEELGLMPPVVDAVYTKVLSHLTEYTPTPIQKLAIPALLSKKGEYQKQKQADDAPKYDPFLLAAETGSGKTMAYLLPLIHHVKEQEELDQIEQAETEAHQAKEKEDREKRLVFDADPAETEEHKNPSLGRPRALILLPSSELITQVTKVVKSLGHAVKYKSAGISSSNSPTVIRNRLFSPGGIDIVVSSPHLIASIAKKEPGILSRIQYLVMDEADSLFDRSFSETTCDIIDRATPSLKQLILCSATIPNSLDRFIDRRFPQCKRIVTPKLHTIPRRVQLGAIDIDRAPYNGSRDLACADVIWTLGKAVHEDLNPRHTVKHLLVFVNEREKAEELTRFLASKGIDAVALTRDTTEQRQAEVLSSFTSTTPIEGSEKPSDASSKKSRQKLFKDFVPFDSSQVGVTSGIDDGRRPTKHLPDTKVLVTTDLGSRGVDTMAVRHVILYDVPHTTIDFVHRLGRMGRMNRRGRGIVLMGRHDRKDIIREVREAMHKGQALI